MPLLVRELHTTWESDPNLPIILWFMYRKRVNRFLLNPARAINHNYIFPSGVFAVLEEIDSKYIIVSQKFAEELFESGQQVSTVELGLNPLANQKKIQKELKKYLATSST
jgi:lipoprotein-releasing system permease protein